MTGQDGTRKDQGSQGIEDTNQGQESGKFPRIHKFLQKIYSKLQLYSKTIEWAKNKKGKDMDWRILGGFWGTKKKDNKSTSTLSSKKRRKTQDRNECFRTCYWKSTILRTRREMTTDIILVQDNATSRKKLWNLQQGIIGDCESTI